MAFHVYFFPMYDFCGIGNACIDIVAGVEEAFLRSWGFPKGICTPMTLEKADALETALPLATYVPGGCAANSAACVTALGGRAAFIGRIGDDKIGARFSQDMEVRHVRFAAAKDPAAGSTRIFCLTTPDAERTFSAYYGAQEDLCPDDLDETIIAHSRFLYLDGYALNSHAGTETFLAAAAMARKAGKSVAFALSDLSVLIQHKDAVAAVAAVSDVLLCNEQEALCLTGAAAIESAMAILRKEYGLGAVTLGENGVVAFDGAGIYPVPAIKPPGPVIDTNGAGDQFAGGFLYGIAKGFDLAKAARIGNRCAAAIITHYGARPVLDYRAYLNLEDQDAL